ncbi:MAG TPA: hypothetical protein VGN57_06045 [Pirellulaceae bacterium]|nr:hypothetical protein [Pirellulaceae bacterium]
MQPLQVIGYFPKQVVRRPEWLKVERVREILSVSDCMSSGPDDRIERWTHNEMWVYPTIAAAWDVVPEGQRERFELLAYRMAPMEWDAGEAHPKPIPELDVEPLPIDFRSVGFDVVSIMEGTAGFGCSPLSCNHLAGEIETNEYCLLPTQSIAEQVAARFSLEEPEPGPYYVVEVMRRVANDIALDEAADRKASRRRDEMIADPTFGVDPDQAWKRIDARKSRNRKSLSSTRGEPALIRLRSSMNFFRRLADRIKTVERCWIGLHAEDAMHAALVIVVGHNPRSSLATCKDLNVAAVLFRPNDQLHGEDYVLRIREIVVRERRLAQRRVEPVDV